ncbi:component of oligomeric golgi complex 6 protein [Lasallia pustulata]|uniref:Conserved oligomeric Golgi complex subunit 6 n=1 Tax=Lasallia pustulata TaxID=136370 RepID=A0A1W5D1T7_9LECA|nr:component of oligomeric golgi complex 6 protein [Lasallia pustulata]
MNGSIYNTTKQTDSLEESLPVPDGATPASRSNALLQKITGVLSTSYGDPEIRDALRTLDERTIQNTPENRRRLRLGLQKDVIESNGHIIKDFGNVAEQLKHIGSIIASLNQYSEEMRRHLTLAKQETAPVLQEASVLLSQKDQIETKQQVLEAFNMHFTISEGDLMVMSNNNLPVDDSFFVVLAKVEKIHKDCQVLLGTESQELGLELMEQSSKNLNNAFQKLYRWIQKEFKMLNLENPQISSPIRRALRVLAERPTLFQSCLDYFAEAREQILLDAFYLALTGSASAGERASTKPIDFYAHDSLRYIGDMLAWTHSSTVSEREALEVLFISEDNDIARGIRLDMASEPWSRPDGDMGTTLDGQTALEQLVSRDLAGVATALRQRVEQVIQSHDDPVLAYKIANLIHFYRVTFAKLLGAKSALLDTLSDLEQSALRQFRANMKDQVVTMQTDLTGVPPDLGIPGFLDEALSRLKDLMKSHDSSLVPASSREAEFQPILNEALDPFLEGCETLAEDLMEPDNSIFVINSLLSAVKNISDYEFTSEAAAEIDDTIEEHVGKLMEYQHAFYLHTSGLHPLVAALAPLSDSDEDLMKILELDSFGPQALTHASQVLDDFLPSALMDAMENLKHLRNSKMAEEVTEEAAGRFCEDFEFVEGRLVAVDQLVAEKRDIEDMAVNGHVAPTPLRKLFPRTSGEIRVLLS